ncbi:MAG TPA: asparaginase [Candidatus Dormibacteraeota bacterium]|nr:asparaginase [Candidatus Dormibacteraeota bacterium]
MPGPSPAHLATARRGTALEAVVRGHVAVVDAAGCLLGGAGDPSAVTTLRSCVKPLQALLEAGDQAALPRIVRGQRGTPMI